MVRKWSAVRFCSWAFERIVMRCPRCNGEFVQSTYEDFPVRICSGCGGIWLDGDVLSKIIEKRHEMIPVNTLESAKNWKREGIAKKKIQDEFSCPVCGRMLKRNIFGYDTGIIIDKCESDGGVFLDKDEIVHLQAFDEIWDDKARAIFKEKRLDEILKNIQNEKDPETGIIEKMPMGRSFLGKIADFLIDVLDRKISE